MRAGSIDNSWIVVVRVWDSCFVPFIPKFRCEQAIFGSSVAALRCARQLWEAGCYDEVYVTQALHASFSREIPRVPGEAPLPKRKPGRGRRPPPAG